MTMKAVIFAHEPETLYVQLYPDDSFDLIPEQKRHRLSDFKITCKNQGLDNMCIPFEAWCRLLG